MIERYSRPEMVASGRRRTGFASGSRSRPMPATRMARLGVIPEAAARAMWESGNKPYTAARSRASTPSSARPSTTSSPSSPHLAELVGAEARFVHQGMTSSDVLDTCLAVQLTQAADLLLADIDRLLAALERRAFETQGSRLTIGRSHGIHAEPTTFGLKLAGFYAEFAARPRPADGGARGDRDLRHLRRGRHLRQHRSPRRSACRGKARPRRRAGVDPGHPARPPRACISPRLASIASSIERLATEIRHLQRTEVREAEEYFRRARRARSAMPHKRNPVLTENLTGLARLVRGHGDPALENVALWHERDISHSSVERMIGPDATVTLDFALVRLARWWPIWWSTRTRWQRNLNRLGGLIIQPARAARADPGGHAPRGRLSGSSNAMRWMCGPDRGGSSTG